MKEVIVVCALIRNSNNQFFCCRRGSGRALAGFWEFPGGKEEAHETHEETIVREIKEELNTDIKPIKYITTVQHTYPDMGEYKGFHITMHAYLCEVIAGELEISEHTEKAWKTPLEMSEMEFAPADKPIVQALLEHTKI